MILHFQTLLFSDQKETRSGRQARSELNHVFCVDLFVVASLHHSSFCQSRPIRSSTSQQLVWFAVRLIGGLINWWIDPGGCVSACLDVAVSL